MEKVLNANARATRLPLTKHGRLWRTRTANSETLKKHFSITRPSSDECNQSSPEYVKACLGTIYQVLATFDFRNLNESDLLTVPEKALKSHGWS